MPCSGGSDNIRYIKEEVTVYRPTPEQQMEHQQTRHTNRKYAAMLCALFNDLKNRGIMEEVIKTASKDGMIDFSSFIDEHEAEDLERIKSHAFQLSKHERQMLLRILKDEFNK